MLEYRLFFFDGAGWLTLAYELLAADDNHAIRLAEAWREGRQLELWQRDRKVRCWGFPNCPSPDCE
jgi:hypothetical protein